ncbi:MAG: FeoA family protein [Christensenellales bacterium]|jgi:ferrous iron transport protein A
MPLAISPLGKEVKIVRTVADIKLKKHLENLGLIMGEAVTPVSDNFGNLIVKIKGCKLAIDKGLAMKIFVS